jgi:hypothetical protein
LNTGSTQGLVDSRHRILRTGALLFLSLDIFFFFTCYLCVNLAGKTMWQFNGFLQYNDYSVAPVLLRYIILGFAIISLPMVIHGKKLALAIDTPEEEHSTSAASLGSIEAAFAHYSHISRVVLGILSLVNFFAGAYFLAYGQFWLLVLVTCIGFFNKLVVFPGQRGFNRWIWRALGVTSEPVTK